MDAKQKAKGTEITVLYPQILRLNRLQHSRDERAFLGMTILTSKHINRKLQGWV